jgi:hypothetical protein
MERNFGRIEEHVVHLLVQKLVESILLCGVIHQKEYSQPKPVPKHCTTGSHPIGHEIFSSFLFFHSNHLQ